MTYTLGDVAGWVDGIIDGGDSSLPLQEVTVDSRQLMAPNSLFIALEGPRFDGHQFVSDAFRRGADAALVHRGNAADYEGNGALIIVDDTLRALQSMAACWRARFSIPVVGVTGSNGKTIVKDMLAGILGREKTVFRSPGSYNSQVGVALALLGLRKEHEVAIIEAGISRIGEMKYLEPMVRPTDGIVTNIGLAHAAGLHDRETTAREKRKLFKHTDGSVVVPASEPFLATKIWADEMFHVKRLPVGDAEIDGRNDDITVENIRSDEGGFVFELFWKSGRRLEIPLNVPGRHNVANAAAAAAMAAHLGAGDRAIIEGLGSYSLREMRLEMHTTGADITLINDAYNADPTSVRGALAVLDNYGTGQRRIAILGDMLDLGGRSRQAHRDVGRHVARLELDSLICVGDLANFIGDGAEDAGMDSDAIERVDDFDALHTFLETQLQPGDVVLFKASRSIGLERAARRLIESVAPTRLYIDLNAISGNFHALRRFLGEDTKVMAVVKSFGYGNDATKVSQTLIQEGVYSLAVAFPDEAIPLINRGLTVPVMVTNVRAEEADKLVKYGLEALVYSQEVIWALSREAKKRNITLDVHLAVDSGMRRAGVRPENLVEFARSVEKLPALRIAGVMTHFAAADVPGEDDFTKKQLAHFEEAVEELRSCGIDPPIVHAANTAAAWRFPQARFDMIRVGLGLYGFHPSKAVEAETTNPVRPALRLTTRVLHIHEVEAGETVGYGRSWRADKHRRLATLAAGYNDGLPYFLSNRGQVLVNGRRCPIVGSVCMDVTVVDITDAGEVHVGDETVLFGEQEDEMIHIDEWAELGHTISYELLCNISPRVRRIFLK